MITSHVELLHHCLEELKPLFDPHWHELGLEQARMPLDPDYDEYLRREAAGQVLCVTLRELGRIVGYFVGFIAPGLHYKSTLTLTMDIFWIHPDQRATDSLSSLEEDLLWTQLFETVASEARRRGVKRPYFGSKVHARCAAIFEQMGMNKCDEYFTTWWGA